MNAAPTPGQALSFYPKDGSGERDYVVATTGAGEITLLSVFDLQPLVVPAAEFESARRKRPLPVAPRHLARRIRRNMKERAAYGMPVAEELAELALSALGWNEPATSSEPNDMISVAIEPRTFANWHTARRAARRALGPAAQEGRDFEVVKHNSGKIAMILKTGKNGITDKIAKGPTNIESQYAGPMNGKPIKDGPSAEQVARDVQAAKVRDAAAKAKTDPVAVEQALSAGKLAGKELQPAKGKPKPAKPEKKKPAPKKPAKAVKAPAKPGKAGSKVQIVADLLRRPEGATRDDILKATGWPSVSVPQQAAAAKLTLRKEKNPGEPTRYFGA